MSENPYESPAAALAPPEALGIGEILPAWERLRIYYNGILFLETILLGLLMLGTRGLLFTDRLIETALVGAVGANVCFCAGPCAEFYLSRVGLGGRASRLILFWAGMGLSLLLVIAALLSPLLPGMD